MLPAIFYLIGSGDSSKPLRVESPFIIEPSDGYLLLLGEKCRVTTNTNVKQQLETHGSVGNDTGLWLLESELSLGILPLGLGLLTEAETLGRENKRKT